MYSSPAARVRTSSWVVTFLLPVAAWIVARLTLPFFHPGPGVFFIAAAGIAALLGGMPTALAGAILNTAALIGFAWVYQPGNSTTSNELWSALLVAVAIVIGLARQRWSTAEMLAGRLS